MELTKFDAYDIPPSNVRISRTEFVAVWRAAVRRGEEQATHGVTDWYAGGVSLTCRWLAAAPIRSSCGRGSLPRSPATRQAVVAYEELIEAEYLAAELLEQRRPDLVRSRPGWCEAVRATLLWAWRGQGPPPIDLAETVPQDGQV